MKFDKIISGGQTGADRGGLHAAYALGIPMGGWCPKGRRAEDGRIPDFFNPLIETPSSDYPQRTEWNARDSDATIIFTYGDATSPGSRLTKSMAEKHQKPCCLVDLKKLKGSEAVALVLDFLKKNNPKILNIAGSRESKAPQIGAKVESVLVLVITSDWTPVDPRTGMPKTPTD